MVRSAGLVNGTSVVSVVLGVEVPYHRFVGMKLVWLYRFVWLERRWYPGLWSM